MDSGEFKGALPWLAERLPAGVRLRRGPRGRAVAVLPADLLLPARRRRRDQTGVQAKVFTDRTAVHRPGGSGADFEVVYQLLSVRWNARLRVKVPLAEGEVLPSVTGLWPAAGWFEREVYDRFGIEFAGHGDRRRILTDYGFEGHPLRKDFPRTGYVEVRYDEGAKRMVTEPVESSQQRRSFDFRTPWRGGLGRQARRTGKAGEI